MMRWLFIPEDGDMFYTEDEPTKEDWMCHEEGLLTIVEIGAQGIYEGGQLLPKGKLKSGTDPLTHEPYTYHGVDA